MADLYISSPKWQKIFGKSLAKKFLIQLTVDVVSLRNDERLFHFSEIMRSIVKS